MRIQFERLKILKGELKNICNLIDYLYIKKR